MITMIFAAFQLGFVYSLLPGPILIASSQRVITGGWRQGVWFVLGVTLADLIYIIIVHWGLTDLLTSSRLINIGLCVLGGGWLIKLGLDAIRLPLDDQWFGVAIRKTLDCKRTLADGLMINLCNPLTILGWVALGANFIGLWNEEVPITDNGNLLVLLSILAGILVWQVFTVGLVSAFRQQMNRRLLKTLSFVGGFALILYGLGTLLSTADFIA